MFLSKRKIRSWAQFESKVRAKGCSLLRMLDRFEDPVLVAGCQRSGTTAVSRVITRSDGMVDYRFGEDDERDAALILSGYVEHQPRGRYCFQTTYLNNCFREYFEHHNYRLIWLLRTPIAVVYSMLYNWRRGALNRLFRACGVDLMDDTERRRFSRWGLLGIPRIRRACLSYNGKVSQLFELQENLGKDRLMVIDYDDLVRNKARVLPAMYAFIDLAYRREYADRIHAKSIGQVVPFSQREAAVVEQTCMATYQTARNCLTEFG